jgi:hypothetical protein
MSGPSESHPINIPANQIIAPASPITYRVVAESGPTAEHINRIADFVEARIDEQFTGDHAARHWGKDPVSRSLRGLLRAVQEMRSRSVLAERDEPDLAIAVTLAMAFAWGELASIAQEWADHPDYLPEFALLAHQLGTEAP